MRITIRPLFCLLVAPLMSCGGGGGGGGDSTPTPNAPAASVTVGTDGGTVAVTDPSSPIFGARVDIPAGALAAGTQITIRAVPYEAQSHGLNNAGPAVDFGPNGLQFQKPVTITLPGMAAYLEDAVIYFQTDSGLFPATSASEVEAESPGQGVDLARATISATTTHFSPYVPRTDPEAYAAVRRGRLSVRTTDLTQFVDVAPVPFNKKDPNGRDRCNCGDRGEPTEIFIHSTDDPNPNQSFSGLINWAKNMDVVSETIPWEGKDITNPDKGRGFAHYYVNSDGAILQLVPDNLRAPHALGKDQSAIGIELFRPRHTERSTQQSFSDYTEAQLTALTQLTIQLTTKYGITNVRRHSEVAVGGKGDPYGWEQPDWDRFKALVKPISAGWKMFSLPYRWSFTDDDGCQYSHRIDADGTLWQRDPVSFGPPCVSGVEKKVGNLTDALAFNWDRETGRTWVQTTAFGTRLDGQVLAGSVQLDPTARLAEFRRRIDGMRAKCGDYSFSALQRMQEGKLSIDANSVSLVPASGASQVLGPLPRIQKGLSLSENYSPGNHRLLGEDGAGTQVWFVFQDNSDAYRFISWIKAGTERRCYINAP